MRPDWDTYFLEMAFHVAKRSTCLRKQVGCILVSESNRILSTGYNGNAPGESHCIDKPCEFASLPKGIGLNKCSSVHAEVNAIAFCPDIQKVYTAYVTDSPCDDCIKILLLSNAKRIVFARKYSHTGALDRWVLAGRDWVHKEVNHGC